MIRSISGYYQISGGFMSHFMFFLLGIISRFQVMMYPSGLASGPIKVHFSILLIIG
jgi:hypothetical protein